MALHDGIFPHHVLIAARGEGGSVRHSSASSMASIRHARTVVCLFGVLALGMVIASMNESDSAQRRDALLASTRASRISQMRQDMMAAASLQSRMPSQPDEGALIKEEASEDNNTRENVAMQAETLRTALRAMRVEAPQAARLELTRADSVLRKGAEAGAQAGLAALETARALLSNVVGQEAALDQRLVGKPSLRSSARMQSLTSNQLSVPDDRAAWRERYMERYATCWPHCAPEANIMNTIDSTRYPYDEEAGGHRWTAWKIGHSGINSAYAQAETKYYNEGSRVREAAKADQVYPNSLGPAYRANNDVSSTSLLGHSPTGTHESRAAYDREVDREWRFRERQAHPYKPLQEGERSTFGGNRHKESRRNAPKAPSSIRRGAGVAEQPRHQMMQQNDPGLGENPAAYEWTGRGGHEENNVWSTNYLRQQSKKYYGDASGHSWAWTDDSTHPSGYYYNVLAASPAVALPAAANAIAAALPAAAETVSVDAAAAPAPTASPAEIAAHAEAGAEDIVHGGPTGTPAQAQEAAFEIVNGAPIPSLPPTTIEVPPVSTDAAPAAVEKARLARVHLLASKKVAAKSSPLQAAAPLLASIGINTGTGDSMGSYGDVRVAAPHGSITVGEMFRAKGPARAQTLVGIHADRGKTTQKLAMTYPAAPRLPLSNWYATGTGAPINTDPNLPAVSFVAAPYGGAASVTLPVYTRTPANPWVMPPKGITAVERAKISAQSAAQATKVAVAASVGLPSVPPATVAKEDGAREEGGGGGKRRWRQVQRQEQLARVLARVQRRQARRQQVRPARPW